MISIKRIVVLSFAFLFAVLTNQAMAKADLTKMRIGQSADKTRVVFEIKNNHRFEVSTLDNPPRIVVDFYKTKNHLKYSKKTFLDKRLKQVRVNDHKKRTRVVLDLRKDYDYNYFTLAKNKSGAERIVIDLRNHLKKAKKTEKKAVKKSAAKATKKPIAKVSQKALIVKKSPVKKVKKAPIKLAKKRPSAKKENKVLNKPTPNINQEKDIVIAIDAGHGGKDPGAIGKYGTYEKNVALAISKKLAKLINKTPGLKAVMTREKDIFLPLSKRVQIAHRKKADIFISVHADSFPQAKVEGGSVYVLSTQGASSVMAKLLAKTENASLKDLSLKGRSSDVAYVLSDMAREANIRTSRKLGSVMLHEMARSVKMHKRKVQAANFAVLKSIDMPSLLIETAFLSTPSEELKLKNPEFQYRMAKSIVRGLQKFLKKTPKQPRWGEKLYVHYKVKKGDTLSEIAHNYQVSVKSLKKLNRISNSNKLYIGKKLRIPLSDKMMASL